MAEYIERETAIEYLMTNMGWKDEDGYSVDDADEKRNIITDLISGIPAADVKPVVRGKWEEREVFTAKGNVDMLQSAFCPVCKRYHTTPYSYYFTVYNYCPNCGADMREQEAKEEPAPGPYDLLHEEGGWNLQ